MLFDGFPAAAADFKDPTLRLAANELNALCLKRFGKAGKWDFKFEIDERIFTQRGLKIVDCKLFKLFLTGSSLTGF